MNAPKNSLRVAVFCVGNKLMLDDGVGCAVYEELTRAYMFPENVELFDVGCLSMDMLRYVEACDHLVVIDAIEGTDKPAGTVFSYEPFDIAGKTQATASLHDLTLADLFEAASLLGYESNGHCFGMQVENATPSVVTIGLTEPVARALPLLIETVLAHLSSLGITITDRKTGSQIIPGWHHRLCQNDYSDAI